MEDLNQVSFDFQGWVAVNLVVNSHLPLRKGRKWRNTSRNKKQIIMFLDLSSVPPMNMLFQELQCFYHFSIHDFVILLILLSHQ